MQSLQRLLPYESFLVGLPVSARQNMIETMQIEFIFPNSYLVAELGLNFSTKRKDDKNPLFYTQAQNR
jgi:hypothetical protein